MRAFIDTSSLVKKYISERGAEKLQAALEKISEIVISPTCRLEITSTLVRRLKERTLTSQQAAWIEAEFQKDCDYFSQVIWNRDLEQKGQELIRKYHLKTLDCIQLASACLSQADIFITSDKVLSQFAKDEVKAVNFI